MNTDIDFMNTSQTLMLSEDLLICLGIKSLLELGVVLEDGLVVDGICEGFGGAYEYADFLRTGDSGVYQVALEHDVVLHRDGHDNYRKF